MSLDLDIQTAPELRGIIGTPSGWTGGGGSDPTPTFSGTYRGLYARTFTFQVIQPGTVGSTSIITVSWITTTPSSGPGAATGYLRLGTLHGYTAGTALPLIDGVEIAFSSGVFVNLAYFTISLTPVHQLPYRARAISSSATGKMNFQVTSFGREPLHGRETSYDGRDWVTLAAQRYPVSFMGDCLDTTSRDALLLMEQEQQEVTFGENYDLYTVYLSRLGRGTQFLPRIGRPGAYLRSPGVATYIDHETGLIRHVQDNVPRYGRGLRGPAIHIDGGSQNELTASAATSGTLFWSVAASALVAWDPNVIGPMDPTDTTWTAGYLTGCIRIFFGPGTTTADHAHTTDTPVGTYSNLYITASVWLKGRGTVNLRARDGSGSITHTANTVDVALTNTWTRYSVTGLCTSPSTVADIAIFSKGTQAVCWAWGWQIEKKLAPTALIQTSGAAAARAAETYTVATPVPAYEGTISFWIKWGGDDGGLAATATNLFDGTGCTGNEQFAIWYNQGASVLQFYTAAAGADRFVQVSVDLQRDVWYHVAVTWTNSAGLISRAIYVSSTAIGGTLSATDTSADWYASFGTGFALAPTLAGMTHIASQYQELRIDSRAWSAAEVTEQYERGTAEIWKNNLTALLGRNFRMDQLSEIWRGAFAPNDILMMGRLAESSRHDDSCIVEAR